MSFNPYEYRTDTVALAAAIERIEELEAENAKLRKLIAQCATDFEAAADGKAVNFYQCAVDLRAALLGGEE